MDGSWSFVIKKIIFQEIYKECVRRNQEANSIYVLGVQEIVDYENCKCVSFSRPESYITAYNNKDATELGKKTANYEIDTEDGEWLEKFNSGLFVGGDGAVEHLSAEKFKEIIDVLEKSAYCHSGDLSDESKVTALSSYFGRCGIVEAVHQYWLEKQKQKGAALLGVFEDVDAGGEETIFEQVSSTLARIGSNMKSPCCNANVLVIESDRCYREEGATVMLECSTSKVWHVVVKTQGSTKYIHPAHELMTPNTKNRFTHAIIWTGENGWKLEFCDRKDWLIFQDIHKECVNKNHKANSAKSNHVPGVQEVVDYEDCGHVPFSRPESYITAHNNEDATELGKKTVDYDIDTEDGEWLEKFNTGLCVGSDGAVEHLSAKKFEEIIYVLEKAAYRHSGDLSDVSKVIALSSDLGRGDIVEAVHKYWLEKRKQKGAALLGVFEDVDAGDEQTIVEDSRFKNVYGCKHWRADKSSTSSSTDSDIKETDATDHKRARNDGVEEEVDLLKALQLSNIEFPVSPDERTSETIVVEGLLEVHPEGHHKKSSISDINATSHMQSLQSRALSNTEGDNQSDINSEMGGMRAEHKINEIEEAENVTNQIRADESVFLNELPGDGISEGRRTSLRLAWILALMAGLLIGYDLSMNGILLQLEDVLKKYFHHILNQQRHRTYTLYCKRPSWKLQGISFAWFLLPIITSAIATPLSMRHSWRTVLRVTCIWIVVGVILGASSFHVSLLIIGRLLATTGVGLIYMVVPKYVAEVCSIRWRKEINLLFTASVVSGSLLGSIMNFYASQIRPWGWRLLLGGEALPCIILFVISLLIVEAPRSYLEQNQEGLARERLIELHGISKGQEEFVKLRAILSDNHETFSTLWIKYKAHLVIALGSQICNTLNGSVAIMIMMPQVFGFFGFDARSTIVNSAITTGATVLSYAISTFLVAKVGRRRLITSSLFVACISLVFTFFFLLFEMTPSEQMRRGPSIVVLCIMCIYNASVAVCSNPNGWLSEEFPLHVTWIGSLLSTSTNWLIAFLVSQALTVAPCYMQAWTFFPFMISCGLFFVVVYMLLPETTNLKVEQVLGSHKLWKKFRTPRVEV